MVAIFTQLSQQLIYGKKWRIYNYTTTNCCRSGGDRFTLSPPRYLYCVWLRQKITEENTDFLTVMCYDCRSIIFTREEEASTKIMRNRSQGCRTWRKVCAPPYLLLKNSVHSLGVAPFACVGGYSHAADLLQTLLTLNISSIRLNGAVSAVGAGILQAPFRCIGQSRNICHV